MISHGLRDFFNVVVFYGPGHQRPMVVWNLKERKLVEQGLF